MAKQCSLDDFDRELAQAAIVYVDAQAAFKAAHANLIETRRRLIELVRENADLK